MPIIESVKPSVRTAAAIVAGAGLSLVAAACGGSPASGVAQLGSTVETSDTAVSAQQSGWLAFSRCMRSHGVSMFPDPAASGELPKVSLQQLGVSGPRFQEAENACGDLRPAGGSLQQETDCLMLGNCPAGEVQRILAAERRYARCMRAHGVPNWPDPTTNSQGMPVFDVTRAGIDRQFIHSSLFRSPNRNCQRLIGVAPVPRE